MGNVTSERNFGGTKMQGSSKKKWFCSKYFNPKHNYKKEVVYVLDGTDK